MSVTSHVEELRKKHQALSTRVEEAERSPSHDALKIRELKRQKLHLKEQISRLSH